MDDINDEEELEETLAMFLADIEEEQDTTFAEIAIQFTDPGVRAIQIGIEQARRTLGI